MVVLGVLPAQRDYAAGSLTSRSPERDRRARSAGRQRAAAALLAVVTTSGLGCGATSTTPTDPKTSAFATSATYAVEMKPPGGFRATAMLAFSAPQHAAPGSLPQCTINGASDAVAAGSLTVTNDTPNYPAQPGVLLEPRPNTSDNLPEVADHHHCNSSATGYGIAYYATRPLSPGESIQEPVWVVIPGYYSPTHPNGDPAVLKQDAVCAYYQDSSGSASESVEYTITGTGTYNGNCFYLTGLVGSKH